MTLRDKFALTKSSLKVKFDCINRRTNLIQLVFYHLSKTLLAKFSPNFLELCGKFWLNTNIKKQFRKLDESLKATKLDGNLQMKQWKYALKNIWKELLLEWWALPGHCAMRELYTSKVSPKTPCLIAKIKLGVSVHWGKNISNPPRSVKKYHAWGIGYVFSQCTDTPNSICAIKQGVLGLTLEVHNFLLAQLA